MQTYKTVCNFLHTQGCYPLISKLVVLGQSRRGLLNTSFAQHRVKYLALDPAQYYVAYLADVPKQYFFFSLLFNISTYDYTYIQRYFYCLFIAFILCFVQLCFVGIIYDIWHNALEPTPAEWTPEAAPSTAITSSHFLPCWHWCIASSSSNL